MKLILLLMIIVVSVLYTYSQNSNRFFRKDYTYLNTTESFYKIHTLRKTWEEARRWCELEGAALFFPEDEAEARGVLELWRQTQPRLPLVYIGVSDKLAKGIFETIDGRSVSDVYSQWESGQPDDAGGAEDCVTLGGGGLLNDDRCDRTYPFICRKPLMDLHWSKECDMPRTDYVLNARLGRCYKFHGSPRNWTEAYRVCSAEQSYLAVLNSKEEADFLAQLARGHQKGGVRGNDKPAEVLVGFHNRDGDGWKTIKGEKLEESGYATWGDKNPDGGDREQCGSMFFNHARAQFNAQLNDITCRERLSFICEHDVGASVDSIDERFNDLL